MKLYFVRHICLVAFCSVIIQTKFLLTFIVSILTPCFHDFGFVLTLLELNF